MAHYSEKSVLLQRAAWESVEWWMRSKYTHYCISSMKISFYHTNKAHTYAMLTPQKCFLSTWWRTFEWDRTESSSHPIHKHHETYLSWIGLFPDVCKSKPYPSFLHLECSCFSHGYTCSPMFLPLQRSNYCQYAMLALSTPVPASPKLPLSWHNLV